MDVVRGAVRAVILAGYFLRFGLELLLCRPATRTDRADWLHRFCVASLSGMGIQMTLEGSFPERGAVISNHLSYLDIIVFAALRPCVFCSKAEIARWPVIGWMTTMSGTVYVERGRGGSALRARSGIGAAVDAGLPVVFFPEGTTSNGDTVLPFHSGLLAQVMATGAPTTAACLQYTLTGTNRVGVTARDHVCWGDDMPLPRHAFHLLTLRGICCTVHFADVPIVFAPDQQHRKLAAVHARNAVVQLRPAQ